MRNRAEILSRIPAGMDAVVFGDVISIEGRRGCVFDVEVSGRNGS
jgi:hypothetical protein